ncbi:hypothetical protein DSTSK_36830 [Desulforhabdus sp. TSK]|nr:hypothetical protein DSTSK_36830 [Desulforhabdus sp. TSK]
MQQVNLLAFYGTMKEKDIILIAKTQGHDIWQCC